MASPMAPLTPIKVPGTVPSKPGPYPTDALMAGVHSALRVSSMHKKQVSGVLHLKHESAGHRGNPSAFNGGPKAFPKSKGPKHG